MNQQIPPWLKRFLKPEDLTAIEQSVLLAESSTTGEVVPMVVRRSSTVGHVPLMVMLTLIVVSLFLNISFDLTSIWTVSPTVAVMIQCLLILLLTAFLGAIPFVQRMLTPKHDQVCQVHQRALNEFYNLRIHHTEKSTGILIFVSLFERQVVILGDHGISAKITQADWNEGVQILLSGLRKGDLGKGFCNSIEWSQALLAHHFPKTEGNPDELQNNLIIKD